MTDSLGEDTEVRTREYLRFDPQRSWRLTTERPLPDAIEISLSQFAEIASSGDIYRSQWRVYIPDWVGEATYVFEGADPERGMLFFRKTGEHLWD